MRYVITGANRGIGLEFVSQLLERGDEVIATARHPDEARELQALQKSYEDQLRIETLDVTHQDTIDALAKSLQGQAVDVLINNGATMIGAGGIGNLNENAIMTSIDVNTLGPLRVTQALLSSLELADEAKVVNITSKMGSIADNGSGGSYAYRISKTALNMATRSMAIDLEPQGIIAFVIHPGWVQTRMGGPNALIDTQTSVFEMLQRIDDADADTSGSFQEWNGDEIPW